MSTEDASSEAEPPEYDEVVDALFETLAALVDLRERLAGGAVRSGVDPAQVIEEVWAAYDLAEADATFAQTDHPRTESASPEDWALSERGVSPRDTTREPSQN